MNEEFILPVTFGDKELELRAKVLEYGYTIKIEVQIEGIPVTFEPDEERNWRAVMGFDLIAGKKVTKGLLEEVAAVIGQLTK